MPTMSALGQKQTFAAQNGMSALHPKADMCSATRYVRFVPIADFACEEKCLGRQRQSLEFLACRTKSTKLVNRSSCGRERKRLEGFGEHLF